MGEIAIVGAGFAGLSAAWHLAKIAQEDGEQISITLIDQKGLGSGASGVSAGLLHPFAGKQAKKNWKGDEGYSETITLINIAQEALRQSGESGKIIEQKGILRLAVTDKQKEDFFLAMEQNPELEWWDSDRCAKAHEGIQEGIPGLYIPDGLAINAPLYLRGLWLACEKLGARLEVRRVNSVDSIIDSRKYETILVTSGYHTKELLPELPLTPVKGQVATFEWPHHLGPLPFPLNSRGYLIHHPNNTCTAGATFERKFDHDEIEPEVAIKEIKELICPFFPPMEQWEPVEIRTGLRASTPSKLPLIGQVRTDVWVATGFGSKGLLYHGLVGKIIAEAIMRNVVIPKEFAL